MTIVCTAGGTGGHIYPAIAIARALEQRMPDAEVVFFCGRREIERNIIGDAGYPCETLGVTGMPRRVGPALVGFGWRLGVATLRAALLLRRYRPRFVLATGGYVSAPPMLAARMLGIPSVVQEQNAFPGVTTRRLARFAELVFLGFPEAEGRFAQGVSTVVTGNPVRSGFTGGNREAAAQSFHLDPARRTVLVVGGSQGARAINEAVAGIVGTLAAAGHQVIWQTGAAEHQRWSHLASERVCILPYIAAMSDAYAACDLVVARAGAMTVAELTVCGLPAVFIPLPTAAENHQEFNARSLADNGAACVIREADLTSDILASEVLGLIDDRQRLEAMASASKRLGVPDAAERIAELIMERFGIGVN